MMHTGTAELLEKLQHASDLAAFFEEHRQDLITQTVGGYLHIILERIDMKPAALAEASQLGNYVYRIINDERNASRDALISIALALRLNVAEAQMLLRIGRHAMLDPRFHRDAALLFALSDGCDVNKANDLLHEIGEATL
ncbi:hypothetical protein LJC27_04560 [Christensenellaceae bacterium OttesenSCG-928-M15]|nr:hypothetical protein [Christensenellaceae bacterium OttesenSCG-928-M15]